ncbi:MAG TPA: glycosyltransferase [Puia sp.]|nr:glycosyltransferase [Puia sp.]
MEKHLHIVCLDVPYPLDYGGVFDLFCKIKTLHRLGIKIHLHCFEYGRGEQPELNNYCVEVNYYPRVRGHKGFSHKLPYIVCSRSSQQLLDNLLKDEFPILLEGVHCTYLLNDERFKNRKIILRLHNIEYKYYQLLFHAEKRIAKKIYFWHESKLLRRYERKIAGKAIVVCVCAEDAKLYAEECEAKNVFHLPVFLPFEKVEFNNDGGCFCLYHGNLSIAENEAVACWLLKKVFNDIDVPFIIAGKNPSANLMRKANGNPHACIISNPSVEEMQDMISKAQINILPSFNYTGVKLKLLNALYNGRHCVVNDETIKGTQLQSACHVCNDDYSFKEKIENLYRKPFDFEEAQWRQELLSKHFNNEKNAEQLIKWIW